MTLGFSRMSLLWRILLSTSVALTALFVFTLVIIQNRVVSATNRTLEEQVNGSFTAYDSLWRARADKLAAVSLVLSKMQYVRAAFSTRDQATISDLAGEFWPGVSGEQPLLLVADPEGDVIASLGRAPANLLKGSLQVVPAAARRFPMQSSGFMLQGGDLYQVVVTPVYIDSARGEVLLNTLVAGYPIDLNVARGFKDATGGSEFAFLSNGRVVVSTLPGGLPTDREAFATITRPLAGVDGQPVGELRIYRSFAAARRNISTLLREVYLIWLGAALTGLALTGWLARKIVEPVRELDRAASQIAQEKYEVRVDERAGGELGRLGHTFNAMCAALETARAKLIRQERISTIGRLSTSIIHDLRNPLGAIYGGAEMLVDLDLPAAQAKRVALNIYTASTRVRELLADLAGVAGGKTRPAEACPLHEIIAPACEAVAAAANHQNVEILVDVPVNIDVSVERARMERVFVNLFVNALEAMPSGGRINVTARQTGDSALIDVEDNGPGIPLEIRAELFEPFVTAGKRGGLGLGLALSRQTMLDHGGDMWIEPAPGARFRMRLPQNPR
jgi:signal transduction histidine kinase